MAFLLLASLLAQDWEYRPGTGFVEPGSKQSKSPEEFLAHGRALRDGGKHAEAVKVFGLLRDHAPALKETAHFERAQTFFAAGDFYTAYHEYESYVAAYPQSDRSTDAKRQEMKSALALARTGHTESLLGLPILSSSKTGIEYLKTSLRRYPREDFSSDFAQQLGKFYYERGDWDLAAAEFAQVLQQYGDTPDAVLALWMLGLTSENRFDDTDYDIKPLKDARRHYERFLEEADTMRKLPEPAAGWVDRLAPFVRERLARVYGLMQEKQLKTAEYYDWKGLPRSAAVYFRSILKDEASFRRVLPELPQTEAARTARDRLAALGMPYTPPPPSGRAAEKKK